MFDAAEMPCRVGDRLYEPGLPGMRVLEETAHGRDGEEAKQMAQNMKDKFILDAHFGEALEECRKLEARTVDLVLTDPPFNHETEHYDTRQDKFLKSRSTFADFAIMRGYFGEIAKEFQRIVKPKGRVLVFCDCYSYPVFWSAFYGLFDHVRALIWYKGEAYFPLGCNQAFRYSYDMILHAFNNESWFDPTHRQDVLKCRNVPTSEREHPAQKPLELVMKLIIATCPKNGVILDPFMGSGTTLVAAKSLERSAIGFDANEQFVEIAKRNIGQPTFTLKFAEEERREC